MYRINFVDTVDFAAVATVEQRKPPTITELEKSRFIR
jgi:hypothetical protein